jgi:predicted dehydrogenase
MTDQVNRRDFFKRTAVGAAGVSLAMSASGTRSVLGANDRMRVGLIGCGRQGLENLRHFMAAGVGVAAVCDVYEPNLQKGLEAAGGHAKAVNDFRQVLDDKEIDVVIVATPDHWHPLLTVMACQAGKDVFVEKPVCVAVEEGAKMVEAARKYNRVVQVGLWYRSSLHHQKAVQLVQGGLIGKVTYVRTWNYSNIYPEGIGNPADSDPPPGLDWDMWLGPAPKVPFNWNRFGVGDRWSTFRYFYDYANGWPGDWAVHHLDLVQWAMGVDTPSTIVASGRKFHLQDNSDTPDTLQITLEYPDFVATYENRLCNLSPIHGNGIEFHGTDGTLTLDGRGFQVFGESKEVKGKQLPQTPDMKMEKADDGLANHVANMLDCMKTRQLPQSDIEFGYHSTRACLLGNIALRTQERLEWDVAGQRLAKGSSASQKLLSREYRAPWKLVV